jgi:peptidoglycan/LPS O-acetylase OafA/YrhL
MRSKISKLTVLDGLRGGAAVYVMVFHVMVYLAAPVMDPYRSWWEWLQAVILFFSRQGHEAVLLFFILSGLAIHLRLAKSRVNGQIEFEVKQYAWRRFIRIYPPLLGALILTALANSLGRAINPEFYTIIPPESSTWEIFIANLLLLQEVVVPTFGMNAPLWSLSFEGFFYVSYPLVFVPVYRQWGARWAFGLGWAISAVGWIAQAWTQRRSWHWFLLAYFGVWLAGAAIAEAFVAKRKYSGGWWVVLALVAMFGLVVRYPFFSLIVNDLLWSVCLFAILLAFLTDNTSIVVGRLRWAVEKIALFAPQSYTIYLIHFPLVLLVLASYRQWWSELPPHFGLVAVGLAVNLLIAWPMNRLEKLGRPNA